MQTDFRTKILADATVSSLMGDRLYAGLLPERVVLPAGFWITPTSQPQMAHSGVTGLTQSRVQVDLYAATSLAVTQLGKAVVTAVNGYKGTTGSTVFDSVINDNQFDGVEPLMNRYRYTVDFIIWHKEV